MRGDIIRSSRLGEQLPIEKIVNTEFERWRRGETLDKYLFGRMKRNLKFKLILGVYEGMLLSSVFVVSLFSEKGALDELRLYAQNPPLTDLLPARTKISEIVPRRKFWRSSFQSLASIPIPSQSLFVAKTELKLSPPPAQTMLA